MRNQSGPEHKRAYQNIHDDFTKRGFKTQLQRLNNKASEILRSYLAAETVDYQFAPPGIHRRNAAKRATRTFKNHFIAGLYGTDPESPLHLWDRLPPQALLTLKLL